MASGIVAEGITQLQRNAALQGLLDTASFKFITSLVGLSLSILYAIFWRSFCLRQIERKLSGFLADLESRLPLRTATAAQEETNALAQRQLTQLETFSNDLAGAAMEVVPPGPKVEAVVTTPTTAILEPRMDIHKNARTTGGGQKHARDGLLSAEHGVDRRSLSGRRDE